MVQFFFGKVFFCCFFFWLAVLCIFKRVRRSATVRGVNSRHFYFSVAHKLFNFTSCEMIRVFRDIMHLVFSFGRLFSLPELLIFIILLFLWFYDFYFSFGMCPSEQFFDVQVSFCI